MQLQTTISQSLLAWRSATTLHLIHSSRAAHSAERRRRGRGALIRRGRGQDRGPVEVCSCKLRPTSAGADHNRPANLGTRHYPADGSLQLQTFRVGPRPPGGVTECIHTSKGRDRNVPKFAAAKMRRVANGPASRAHEPASLRPQTPQPRHDFSLAPGALHVADARVCSCKLCTPYAPTLTTTASQSWAPVRTDLADGSLQLQTPSTAKR